MAVINHNQNLWVKILIIILELVVSPIVVAKPADYTLQQVVVLSRHGVRSPLQQSRLLNEITPDCWPKWPVKPGYLTPRGELLMTLMGKFYGDYFRKKGLLPEYGCPANGTVYVHTDVEQRTLLSGSALLFGMIPHCGFKIHHQNNLKRVDPLFHPVESGICALNKEKALNAIEEKLGAPLQTLNRRYSIPLAQMAKILRFDASPYCKKMHKMQKSCDFASFLSNKLEINNKGRILLRGPLSLSSTLSEIFLLQNSQGMPDVAWHRLKGEANWQSLLSLHNAQFDLVAKTFYLSRHEGTPLLEEIGAVLTHQTKKQSLLSPLPIPADNRVVFLVGHDGNIANIAGMLGLHWQLLQQPDNTPPGGGLVFELWQNKNNHLYYVSIKMFYQTMAQLRNMENLDLTANPAGMMSISIPGCDNTGKDKLCQLETFQKKLNEAIEPNCRINK